MFTLMFGCTGNRCRSPYAEVYLARLVADLPVRVISAGTLDVPDQEVPEELVEIAAGAGLELGGHRSRVLSQETAEGVDVFVGFERGHVAAAVVDAGIPPERAFTLPELVRLLEVIEPPDGDNVGERARRAIARAAERRKTEPSFVPGEEIADPFRRARSAYERAAAEIAELCGRLNELLFRRRAT